MSLASRSTRAAVFALPLLVAGCSIMPVKRHLPVPKAPAIVLTATPEELVNQLDQRWDALHTLTATVEITATEFRTAEGFEKDFPSCRGYILMRKPNMLRVAGTFFGVPAFNMASDGEHFTLVIPQKNLAIEGADTVKEKNPESPLLNLRPGFFLDAIAVRGLAPDDEYMVVNDTETVEDVAKKHLYIEPEYVLSVMRPKTGREITPVRVITIRRDDMLPYNQDIYDSDGTLETQVIYSNYAQFTAGKYPSHVTIKRPKEGIQLVLDVVDVKENVELSDSQFQVKIPDDAKIQQLK